MTQEEIVVQIERQLAEYMGPLASVVIKDKAAEFGKNLDEFPEHKLAELVEEVSFEIQNNRRKIEFQRAALEILREAPSPPVAPVKRSGLTVKREEKR